jgi:hypothetical protein
VLSTLSTAHDSDVQMYPKQARLWGMISSQSVGYPGYARDCRLDVSGSGVMLGWMYQGGMVQRSRLGLVHMSLASFSPLILMHAISCVGVVVESSPRRRSMVVNAS